MAQTYRKRFQADPSDPRHGSIEGYNMGCKCDRCREASRLYSKQNRERYRAHKQRMKKERGK